MGKGYRIAGLVLGIVSICLSFAWIFSFFALAMSIVGLILSVVGNKHEKDAMGTAALVLCIIGLGLSAIGFLACGVCFTLYIGILDGAGYYSLLFI